MGRRRKAAVQAGLLAVSLACALACGCGDGNGNGQPTEVQVAAASRGRVSETVEASVRLEAGREALLFGAGRVVEVAASEGDTVSEGQVLVSLSGDAAAAEAMQAARMELAASETELENARRDLERAASLHSSGAVSLQELEGAETAVEAARAAVDGARARLAAAEASAVASTVNAPFDGVVGRVWARKGALAGEAPLVQLVSRGALQARLLLPRRYAGRIRTGADAAFSAAGSSFPELAGSVASVAAGLDPESGLLPVTLTFPARHGIAPGLMGRVSIVTRSEDDVLTVPRQALQRTADCCRVIVVSEGVARVREVVTGLDGNGLVEIRSGLEAGETVVTGSTAFPSDGDSVTVAED